MMRYFIEQVKSDRSDEWDIVDMWETDGTADDALFEWFGDMAFNLDGDDTVEMAKRSLRSDGDPEGERWNVPFNGQTWDFRAVVNP